jgi:uncharacterized protein (TIGR03437 family)
MSTKRTTVAVLAVLFPIAAIADISGTLTIAANTQVSMDSGTVVSSGGDFLWDGTKLTPQGSTKALNATTSAFALSGASGYSTLTPTILQLAAGLGSSAPLTGLAANTVVGYVTNGGNFGKFLVTAVSGSLTIQYTTYESATPKITSVQNNYSLLVPGLPNYGIAQGSLFIIKGTSLASIPTSSVTLQSSGGSGIPKTLNGASISVTVNGTTVQPGIYYAGATQVAAVLPANTPVGTGTVTLTYSGTASNVFSIQVVASALGLDTYYGSGSGLGVATNPTTGVLYTYTNSISPGSTIVLWGSGAGSTGDSDTVFTSTPHAASSSPTIYIGGVQATVLYAGSAGYPGVDQINVTVPTNVPTGCGISLIAVNGSIVSNEIALPINQGGGVCSDPLLGINGTQLTNQGTQTSNFTSAGVQIFQSTSPTNGETTNVTADFASYQNVSTTSTPSSPFSLGSCIVTTSGGVTIGGTIPTITGLDAGTITVSGPAGSLTLTPLVIPMQSGPSGVYSATPPNSFLPATGGSFTFTGTGGANVGPFTATVSIGNLISWTNQSASSTVNRANGQNITWTGGSPNTYVYVGGSSASASGVSASFVCYAPASAGQLTVPSYVLLALPPSTNGNLGVSNSATPASFTASGLTAPGSALIGVTQAITAAYQ